MTSHIPGAIYAHIDEDLSGPVTPGKTGRHPLPEPAALAEKLSSWGVDERVQVVAYDDSGGAMAARLWWLLRWLGHDAVAVVDGGWSQWQAAGLPVTPAISSRTPRIFAPRVRGGMAATTQELNNRLGAPGFSAVRLAHGGPLPRRERDDRPGGRPYSRDFGSVPG